MGSLQALVLLMQVCSLFIVAAGAYLCLVYAGILPTTRAMNRFAIAASCVVFGAAIGAVALSVTMRFAPAEAAEYAAPAWDAPSVMPVSLVLPLAAPAFVAPAPAAARGDGSFALYEYH